MYARKSICCSPLTTSVNHLGHMSRKPYQSSLFASPNIPATIWRSARASRCLWLGLVATCAFANLFDTFPNFALMVLNIARNRIIDKSALSPIDVGEEVPMAAFLSNSLAHFSISFWATTPVAEIQVEGINSFLSRPVFPFIQSTDSSVNTLVKPTDGSLSKPYRRAVKGKSQVVDCAFRLTLRTDQENLASIHPIRMCLAWMNSQ